MSRTWFFCTLCGLSAAVSLSCYRSGSVSVPPPASPLASTQSARAVEDRDSGAVSPEGAIATSANADERASPEVIDAEEVLKTALARAADEKKLLLVHLGSPG